MDNVVLTCGPMEYQRDLKSRFGKYSDYLYQVSLGTGFYRATLDDPNKSFQKLREKDWYPGLGQLLDLEDEGRVFLFILDRLTVKRGIAIWELLSEDYNSLTHKKIIPRIDIIQIDLYETGTIHLLPYDTVLDKMVRYLNGKTKFPVTNISNEFESFGDIPYRDQRFRRLK